MRIIWKIFVLTFKIYEPNAVITLRQMFPLWAMLSVNRSFIVYLSSKPTQHKTDVVYNV